jgi:hypothetical protein
MEAPLIRNPCEKLIRADYMLKLFQQLTHRRKKASHKDLTTTLPLRRMRAGTKPQRILEGLPT